MSPAHRIKDQLIKSQRFNLAVTRSMRLNNGQKVLYELLIQAIKTKSIVTRKHIETVYKNSVERSPDTWNYYKERFEDKDGKVTFKGGYEPRSDWQFKQNSMIWFTSALGSLIKKGYLTVIPRFNLEEFKAINE